MLTNKELHDIYNAINSPGLRPMGVLDPKQWSLCLYLSYPPGATGPRKADPQPFAFVPSTPGRWWLRHVGAPWGPFGLPNVCFVEANARFRFDAFSVDFNVGAHGLLQRRPQKPTLVFDYSHREYCMLGARRFS